MNNNEPVHQVQSCYRAGYHLLRASQTMSPLLCANPLARNHSQHYHHHYHIRLDDGHIRASNNARG